MGRTPIPYLSSDTLPCGCRIMDGGDGIVWCPVHASAPALLSIAQDCLHQLATDSDLDEILGAPKYRILIAELRTVIAQATGEES